MLTKLNRKHAGFTLVEIMIVVAIIALLAAIAVPGFLRARKRSQASKILNDLRMIDAAVDQYAIETNRTTGNVVRSRIGPNTSRKTASFITQARTFLAPLTVLRRSIPFLRSPSADYAVLSDVASTGFWSPYGP